jgi:hypothetical protein
MKNPTIKTFINWKNDFLKLKNIKLYRVYLVGSFVDKLNETFSAKNLLKYANLDVSVNYTDEDLKNMSDMELMLLDRHFTQPNDIDVIIVGPDDKQKIKDILYQGIKLGIEKYDIKVDIWWREHLLHYNFLDGLNYTPENIIQSKHDFEQFLGIEIGKSVPSKIYISSKNDKLLEIAEDKTTEKHIEKVSMGYEFPLPMLIS